MDPNANKLTSLEVLLASAKRWQSIDAPILGERILPGVCAISSHEIVVLGGNDGIWNFLSDCFVFDLED